MDMHEAARRAQANATHEALESLSDEGAPLDLLTLSLMAQVETGQRITAVKRSTRRCWVPAQPPADGAGLWHLRRLTGQRRQDDPEPVEETVSGWAFVVDGNPLIVMDWLKRHGCPGASGLAPNLCFVRRDDGGAEVVP